MASIREALMGAAIQLCTSKEADRVVQESQTMADMLKKLVPVAIGILITGAVQKSAGRWPSRKA